MEKKYGETKRFCKPCFVRLVIHRIKRRMLGIKTQNMEIWGKNDQIYRVIHGFIHNIHKNWSRD